MTKYDLAVNYWSEVTEELMTDKRKYADFLKFSSGIYKYSFSDSAMIYRQNPKATKVAELNTWNKLGRMVNRGESSIVSFTENGQCKYLFDVSQTHGRKEPEIWHLDKDLSDRLTRRMNEKHGTDNKNLDETLASMCLDSVKASIQNGYAPYDYNKMSVEQRRIINRSMLSAARYMVSNRCKLGSDIQTDTSLNLDGLDLCNGDIMRFKQFADLVHSSAKDVLKRLEKEIIQLNRERVREQELSQNIEPPYRKNDTVEMEDTTYRVSDIDRQNDTVKLTDIDNSTHTISVGAEELTSFYSPEQREKIMSAISGVLGEDTPIIENEPVETVPDIEPLEDKELIENIMLDDTARYEGNSALNDFFSFEADMSERQEYLKTIIKDGITEIELNGRTFGIEKTENGLNIFEGKADERVKQSGLSWDSLTALVSELHEQKQFANIEEDIDFEEVAVPEQEEVIEEVQELSVPTRRIQCETLKQAEELIGKLREDGYTWIDGEELDSNDWAFGEENTYYSLDEESKTVELGDVSVLSQDSPIRNDIELYSDVRSDFVREEKTEIPDTKLEFSRFGFNVDLKDIDKLVLTDTSNNSALTVYQLDDGDVNIDSFDGEYYGRNTVSLKDKDFIKFEISAFIDNAEKLSAYTEKNGERGDIDVKLTETDLQSKRDEQPETKTDNSIVDDFRAKTAEKFNTMDSWSAADIEDLIKNHVIETLQENEIQFREDSVRAVLYGSRARGLEQSGSDIDVVVEIDTDEREDHLFNLLNSKPYMFSSENYESIPVDINPITPYETGTLEMYLPRAEEYLVEKAESMERENNVSALDRAKNLINDFCVSEYNSEADLSDLSNVSLAYTTDEEFELPIQVSADLENYRINYEYDGEIFKTEQYDSIDDMNSNGLTGLDFNDLVSVPDSVIEKHNKDRNNSEIKNSEEKSEDISDPAVIPDTSQKPENSLSVGDIIRYNNEHYQIDRLDNDRTVTLDSVDYNSFGGVLVGDSEVISREQIERDGYEIVYKADTEKDNIHAAFEELKQNNNFDFRQQTFLKRAEQQMKVNGFTDFEKAVETPVMQMNYGNKDRINNLFKGKLSDITNEINSKLKPDDKEIKTEFVPQNPLTRESFHTESADTIVFNGKKGEPASLSRIDVDVSDELYSRLAEHGINRLENSVDKVIFDTDGEKWNRLAIPDKNGNVWNNIAVEDVLTPEEVQTAYEVGKEVAQKAINEKIQSRQKKQDNSSEIKSNDDIMTEISDRVSDKESVKNAFANSDTENLRQEISSQISSTMTEMLSSDPKSYSDFHNNNPELANDNTVIDGIINKLKEEQKAPDQSYGEELPDTRFTAISNESRIELNLHAPVPEPKNSPWGEVQNCVEINTGIFDVSTASHGGIMIKNDIAAKVLSKEARAIGFKENGYTCFEEDCEFAVPMREIIDKKLFKDIDGYFKHHYNETADERLDKFSNSTDNIIDRWYKDYKTAREQAIFSALPPEKQAEKTGQIMFDFGGSEEVSKSEIQENEPEKEEIVVSEDKDNNRSEKETKEVTEPPTAETSAEKPVNDTVPPQDYKYQELPQLTGKQKYKANVEAIKTLQDLESENRNATPEEQAVLAQYSGWGGIPQAFDPDNKGWEKEYHELKELLTESEYSAARASTLTSFYTPPELTNAVYQALTQFGFEGGNVLEPSMGVGNFFGKMPEEMHDNSKLYGVELDSISGRISKKLYPNANVQIKGFESTKFADNSFDVALGNIPFGDIPVSDKAYDKYNLKIHDYFACKMIDKVKPNGIAAFVSSKFVMDKMNDKARRYIAERADLLGAVRLPTNAFGDTATTTDILFFKKKELRSLEIPDWVQMSQTPDGIPCNKYFADNPDMVLGKMAWDERMRGKYGAESKVTACVPTEGDLKQKLTAAISKIQGKIETVKSKVSEKKQAEVIPADPDVKNFTYTLVGKELYFRKNEIMEKSDVKGSKRDRIAAFCGLRKAAFDVINAQVSNCSDKELDKLQKTLNEVYDRFKAKFGNINDRSNSLALKEDDDYNTLCAFEITNKRTGELEKSEIFFKRTITAEEEITKVDTPAEALQVSLDRKGKVDIEYMAQLTEKEPEKVIEELGTEIFRNPAKLREDDPFSGYEDKSEYLSGNVREKLELAEKFTEHIDPEYERNVKALQEVIPPTIPAEDISVELGCSWIDVSDYSKFMEEYAKADMKNHPLRRDRAGEYKVESKSVSWIRDINSTATYGTSRLNSYQIFENLLNKRSMTVRDKKTDDEGKEYYVVNDKETELARDKAKKMKEEFPKWFWGDINRREKYVERYNKLFNSYRGRDYDGSHQTFVGMNPAIKLRPHQLNAVLRGKLGGNTLLAHCVGAGKSFEMDTIVMEKKRLGLINKACVVVPKHLTLQTAHEWQRLYPNAKLLVATPQDFTPQKKQEFAARCVTGDYDGVIMSYEQFGGLPMSSEYREKFIRGQIDKIMDALEDTDKNDRTSVKDLERQKKRLETKLDKLLNGKKDNTLSFEQIGFDYLVVDEAHNYKNCLVVSKMHNIAGVQTTSAAKSEDMLMKTQYLRDKYGEGTCCYATGTPVSNSMVELYSMTRYLRPDLLEKAGLQTFDDWASNFGEVVSQLEIKPAGNGYRTKERFAKFKNLPELMAMYKEFADIQMEDTLHLPNVPTMESGKPIIVKTEPDPLQKAYMKRLAQRAEAIHNGNIDPRVDNMLKITHEARLLGLDGRCLNKNWVANPDGKIMKLCDNLEKIYRNTEKEKGVQIVFCDIAINEDEKHFSAYNAVREELAKRGIPREEVCFAGEANTDAQKSKMHEQLRSGEKRVILASTSKLGTGANVQDRVAAIHHLDTPWRPADLTQQNGRGLRQGNMFKEVGVYHYVTENTFDAYMLGIITNKAKFISQVMTSKDTSRTCEDVDEMVLNYSEMQAIASGNPMIKEKIQLDMDVSRLRTLENEYHKNLYKMQEMAQVTLPEQINKNTELLEKAKADLETVKANLPSSDEFKITISGKTFDERKAAGEQLEKEIVKTIANGQSMRIGNYAGLDIAIEKNPQYGSNLLDEGTSPCIISVNGGLKYQANIELDNAVGNIRRIENLAKSEVEQRITVISEALEQNKKNLEAAKAECEKPFEHQEELTKALDRLEIVNKELSVDKPDEVRSVLDEGDEPDKSKESGEERELDNFFDVDDFDITPLLKEMEKIQEEKMKPDIEVVAPKEAVKPKKKMSL